MKAVFDRAALASEFLLVGGYAPTRSPKEVLQNVKLTATGSRVVLEATNEMTGIKSEIPADVEVEGSVLLPVQRVSSILRESVCSDITIEVVDTSVVIKGKGSKFKFPTVDSAGFPSPEPVKSQARCELAGAATVDAFNRVLYATSKGEHGRYALSGVKIELNDTEGKERNHLTMIATDGRRLALQEVSVLEHGGSFGDSLVIDQNAAKLLARSIVPDSVVEFRADHRMAQFAFGHRSIYTRLIEGVFPPWQKIVPDTADGYSSIKLDPSGFIQAVRQAGVVTDQESKALSVKIDGSNMITIEAKTADIGASNVEYQVEYTGDPAEFVVDYKYLLDAAKAASSAEFLILKVASETSPVVIVDDQETYLSLIMPMATN